MATKRQFCICLYSILLVLIALATLNLVIVKFSGKPSEGDKMSGKYVSVDFEVFGIVQGVFFRKYTKKKGEELDLVGWCMNTDHESVVGQMQGEPAKIEKMKHWLQTKGSPSSQIERAEFKDEKYIDGLTFKKFDIRR